ncbi:MAG: hypothetical protein AAF202_12795, partial [Pseudomonadota bacterium]
NPRDVVRAGFRSSRIQWIYFEWRNQSGRTFGPVYIGISRPSDVKARGYSKSRDIPATRLVMKRSGRWVAGILNEID